MDTRRTTIGPRPDVTIAGSFALDFRTVLNVSISVSLSCFQELLNNSNSALTGHQLECLSTLWLITYESLLMIKLAGLP